MDASNQRRRFWIAAAVWCAAAFGLRLLILHNSVMLDRRILASRSALLWTLIFSLAGLVLLYVLGLGFRKTPAVDTVFCRNGLWTIPALLGAALLFAGNLPPLLALLRGEGIGSIGKLRLLAALFGLTAAPLMAAVLLGRRVLGKNAFWLQLPLILFAGVNMICHFRTWSHDPIILDIAPLALSAVCFLLGVVLIAGFSVLVGRRRSTAVWCSMAVIFTAMSLPDYLQGAKNDVFVLLSWLGLALWCGWHAVMLIADPNPEAGDAPKPEVPAEDPES